MKKIALMGRSESGKTTLIQALRGGVIDYRKTQYAYHENVVIDTPGEWTERALSKAMSLYTYEAQVVGLVMSATEQMCRFRPGVAAMCNRPIIGIITKIDSPDANIRRATEWLHVAGVYETFNVSAYTGEGIWEILDYLKEPGDVLPWESEEEADSPRLVKSDKYGAVNKVGAEANRFSWVEYRAGKIARERRASCESDVKCSRVADQKNPRKGESE